MAARIDRNQDGDRHGLDTGIAGGHEKVETRQWLQSFLVPDGIARELLVDIGSLPQDDGLGRRRQLRRERPYIPRNVRPVDNDWFWHGHDLILGVARTGEARQGETQHCCRTSS